MGKKFNREAQIRELIGVVESDSFGHNCCLDRGEKRKINKEDLTNTAKLYAEKEGISLKKAKRIVGFYYSEPRPVVA